MDRVMREKSNHDHEVDAAELEAVDKYFIVMEKIANVLPEGLKCVLLLSSVVNVIMQGQG